MKIKARFFIRVAVGILTAALFFILAMVARVLFVELWFVSSISQMIMDPLTIAILVIAGVGIAIGFELTEDNGEEGVKQ